MMLNKIITLLVAINLISLAMIVQANQYQQRAYQQQAYQQPDYQQAEYQQQRYRQQDYSTNSQQQTSPVEILQNSINNVLDFLAQSNSQNIIQLRSYVNNQIAPNFDFDYMSRWVAGKRYNMMSEAQRSLFKHKFMDVFLSTFIEKITRNRNSLPRVGRFASKRISQNEARASVMFGYSNNTQVRVSFRFIKTKNNWKVVDVKANGLSALMYFKNHFSQLLKNRQANNI